MPFVADDSDGEDGHADDSPASSDSAFGAFVQADHSDDSDSPDSPEPSSNPNHDHPQASNISDDASDVSSEAHGDASEVDSEVASEAHGDTSDVSSDAEDDASDVSSDVSSEADDNRDRRRPARLFDLEAEDDQDSDVDSKYDEDDSDDQDTVEFYQFKRFPPEIKLLVWEAYCPDLTSRQGRVYDVFTSMNYALNVTLPQRTQEARNVLSIEKHSRYRALQAFPDELPLPVLLTGVPAVLRFHAQRDIIIVNNPRERVFRSSPFMQQVRNLAVGAQFYQRLEDLPMPGSQQMPDLQQVFFIVNASECRIQDTLSWCALQPTIVSNPVTFVEKLDERELKHVSQYCWPDVNQWPGFIGHEREICNLWGIGNVPFPQEYLDNAAAAATAGAGVAPIQYWADDESEEDPAEAAHRYRSMTRDLLAILPIYPLVEFQDERFLHNVLSWNGDPEDWRSDWDDEDGYLYRRDDDWASTNEDYASSGIDDSEIEELDQGHEDEDDLDLDLDEEDEPDHLGFDGELDLSGDEILGELPPAHFSSSESATVRGDSSSMNGDHEEEPVQHGQSGDQTVITIDNDTDDDSDEKVPRKRKRAARDSEDSSPSSNDEGPMRRSRKRRVISDDSDSDDSAPRKRVRRSARVGDSDSEYDVMEESSDDDVPRKSRKAGRRANPIELSDSESDSASGSNSGSEDDDDAPPSKPLSLAERLALNRDENPIPISDSEDGEDDSDSVEEEEEGDEEDHDGGAVGEYAYGGRFPDDEEGNDNSSEEEEAQEGEILDLDEGSDEGY